MFQEDIEKMTNHQLSDHLKKVVWVGGWDATLKEVEKRLKKLTQLEKKETNEKNRSDRKKAKNEPDAGL